MDVGQISLRGLIDKWLAPASGVRVTQFSRTGQSRGRFVRVETEHSAGTLAIYFFRHGDGSWCVFPPSDSRATLVGGRMI